MRIAWLVVLVSAACGKSGGVGGDSPEAPMRDLLTATTTGDVAAMRHALVSPDRLRKAVSCPPTSELFSDLQGAIQHVGEAAAALQEAKPKLEIVSIDQTGITKLAKGDNFRGCIANEPFEVRNFSFKLELEANGRNDQTDDTGDVIQLDGRWYALLKE